MATKKKLLEAAAGSAGGAALNVEDVFSTYLYTGNASTQTITNGIDLSGEGGLVWIKSRSGAQDNHVFDTERGAAFQLRTNTTIASSLDGDTLTQFNSDGFLIDDDPEINASSVTYASWTFRKAPKFFDVVTYTGTGSSLTINHNLGVEPAVIIIKRTDSTANWIVFTDVIDGTIDYLYLNLTNGSDDGSALLSKSETSFTLLSSFITGNFAGAEYVAYLFAHNDGDGDFGSTADQDIIKCGSYTSNETSPPEINLGFEPQWILIKKYSAAYDEWVIFDNMRGVASNANDAMLRANTSQAEYNAANQLEFTSTGFKLTTAGLGVTNAPTGEDYIYIAIRRGPMAVPESATDVFAVDTLGGTSPTPPAFYLGAPVDLQVWRSDVTAANNWEARDRLRGLYGRLKLNLTDAEDSNGGNEFSFDQMLGQGSATGTNTNRYSWMWKRAPSFMDVVTYTGNGVAGRTVSHNLGVAPEMMWVKRRNIAGDSWMVYHATLGETKYIALNQTSSAAVNSSIWNNTAPTETTFTVGNNSTVNTSGSTYIAYLFASLAGVSKVGSYTGNGSSNGDSQNIDCGFSSGARFVLIKRTDNTGNWLLFDTKRGIISGNDPALRVNSTGSNFNGYDFLEPNSNGFNVLYQDVSSSYNPNISGASYIFYAIA